MLVYETGKPNFIDFIIYALQGMIELGKIALIFIMVYVLSLMAMEFLIYIYKSIKLIVDKKIKEREKKLTLTK